MMVDMRKWAFVAVILIAKKSLLVWSQAPDNDVCTDALVATQLPATWDGDTTFAGGSDLGDEPCGSTASNVPANAPGVWYGFTGTGAITTLSLENINFASRLYVFDSDCGNLFCFAWGGFRSMQLETVAGREYRVYVTGITDTSSGSFRLNILDEPSPDNDDCTLATSIPTIPSGIITASTAASTYDGASNMAGFCGFPDRVNNRGIWYQYAAAEDALLEVRLSNYDSRLRAAVMTGTSCTALECVNGDSALNGELEVSVPFNATAGGTYWIMVGTALEFRDAGDFSMVLREFVDEPIPQPEEPEVPDVVLSNACVNAIVAPTVPYTANNDTSTLQTIQESFDSPCTDLVSGPGLWYRVTGRGYNTSFSVTASFNNWVLLARGCETPVPCLGGGNRRTTYRILGQGDEVLVYVAGVTAADSGPFELIIEDDGPPADDGSDENPGDGTGSDGSDENPGDGSSSDGDGSAENPGDGTSGDGDGSDGNPGDGSSGDGDGSDGNPGDGTGGDGDDGSAENPGEGTSGDGDVDGDEGDADEPTVAPTPETTSASVTTSRVGSIILVAMSILCSIEI